jgi:hypothetical protein
VVVQRADAADQTDVLKPHPVPVDVPYFVQPQPRVELLFLFNALPVLNTGRVLLVPWDACLLVLYFLVYFQLAPLHLGVAFAADGRLDLQRAVHAQTADPLLHRILHSVFHPRYVPKLVRLQHCRRASIQLIIMGSLNN